jgi:L-aminopeptidase/D-esterase-like protein
VSDLLKEGGHGYRTQYARIPLVSGAVIYDLGIGKTEACPQPKHAYEAAASATTSVEEGSVGVGTGATVGKLLGKRGMMKGGIALSTVEVGRSVTVSALTVVNALGDVLDEQGAVLAGAREDTAFVGSKQALLAMTDAPRLAPLSDTTLSVVMTDGRLDKLQCGMVARMSHDGLARAIDPVHTPVDGDCVFVLATGRKETNVFQLGAAAADAVATSVRRAVRVAQSLGGVSSVAEVVGEMD